VTKNKGLLVLFFKGSTFVGLLDFLQEEKSNLSAEFEHLQAQMGSRATGGPVDSGIRYRK
jgi:hypothetical protein